MLVASWDVPMPVVIGMISCSLFARTLVDVRRMLSLLATDELIPITAVKAPGGRVTRDSRVPVPASLPFVCDSVRVSVRPPVTSRLPVVVSLRVMPLCTPSVLRCVAVSLVFAFVDEIGFELGRFDGRLREPYTLLGALLRTTLPIACFPPEYVLSLDHVFGELLGL